MQSISCIKTKKHLDVLDPDVFNDFDDIVLYFSTIYCTLLYTKRMH